MFRCFQCGSSKEKEVPTEMFSIRFPERRREFCCWPCAVKFLNSTNEWRDDKQFAVQTIHECGCRIMRNI